MSRQQNSLHSARLGFTLIELLVVIGIIGVLSAVMIGMMGGTSESAKATQCMTNLRSLSVAVLNYAMQDDDGNFPAAGSHKWTYYGGGTSYPERKGWISWNYPHPNNKSKAGGSVISFNESDDKLLRFAVTNGCIWACGGKSEKAYVCPTHDAACLKANKRHPGWSYMMNESFGWARNGAGTPLASWTGLSHNSMRPYDSTKKTNVSRSPDKVLLFAEMQGLTDAKHNLQAVVNGSGDGGDGVLQYRSSSEVIGFNHKQSGGKLSGHVAFADGHVEKLLYPSSGNVEQLTKWLCSGREVSFNGSMYQDLQGND